MRSSTLPPKPPMRNFRPLMSATDLISLRYQPPIWAPVLPPGKLMMLYLAIELAHQLQAVAFVHPGRHLAAVQAEGNGAVQREGRILAEEVVRRGVGHFDGAVGHAVQHAERGHQFASPHGS
jgi:hypothetical protein